VGDVHLLLWGLGGEVGFGFGGDVDEAFVFAGVAGGAGVGGHDGRVHVDGGDGVGGGDDIIRGEDVEDVAGVALGAVGDEDLIGSDVGVAGVEVVLGDGFAEEVVALLGAVAVEGFAAGHVVHGLVHGFDDGGRKGLGDVADAHADDLGGGVVLGERR